ncbi:reverse transcriptase/maturase family protein [Chrysiogenes arsenatis]|uniref:reverse transcriptase/maturase family protein n=1 Tax=Chrysiogenes arsenatis TaxID=309797 RepID=UPI00191C57B2|nr:reverse transcriptase/maturase family protein [Chrysiogenes arsenatis]
MLSTLFTTIVDFESLHSAYLRARRGKRDRCEVMEFERDLEGNLIALQNELMWDMYRVGRYRNFIVYEPKQRMISALPFRDRVVQHALVAAIEPFWQRRFIFDSYACRPEKGTHRGADRAQRFLRIVQRNHGAVYVLKADIARYFPSVDHGVLKCLLRKRVSCEKTLELLDGIIDAPVEGEGVVVLCGIPIGNLTSQLFANIYLHELDLYVKHTLRERYYVRYMDDFCIVHWDKSHLHELRRVIEGFLWDVLRLRTNAKTQVFPVGAHRGRALDFLGYKIFTTHRRLRNDSIARIKRTLRKLKIQYEAGEVCIERVRQSVQSWLAHSSHADARGLQRYILERFPFVHSLK